MKRIRSSLHSMLTTVWLKLYFFKKDDIGELVGAEA